MTEELFQKETQCSCERCIKACSQGNPGWFLPGEAERAAEFLGIDFDEFQRTYLIRDFWTGEDDSGDPDSEGYVEILAPFGNAIGPMVRSPLDIIFGRFVGSEFSDQPGERATYEYALFPKRCVFLTEENRCRIYAVRPIECRVSNCCDLNWKSCREEIANRWREAREG